LNEKFESVRYRHWRNDRFLSIDPADVLVLFDIVIGESATCLADIGDVLVRFLEQPVAE